MLVNNIAQFSIFDYVYNKDLIDLERLPLVMNEIPFHRLINTLDAERSDGRNDYPNLMMFNITITRFLVQRLPVDMMRRELAINPTLRQLVGISDEECRGFKRSIIPPKPVFTRFQDRMIRHMDLINDMYAQLRERIYDEIPGVGVRVSGDGKYFDSYTPNAHSGEISNTRRAEHDATYSVKKYPYVDASGATRFKKETHYGFRKHTLVDAMTELPLASTLVPANEDEKGEMTKIFESLPGYVTDKMEYASFDRGYDSEEFLKMIRSYGVKPIIDKRRMRPGDQLFFYKEFEDTRLYYNEAGEIFYLDYRETDSTVNPDTGYPPCIKRAKYNGYRKDKHAISYLCNAVEHFVYIDDQPRIFNEVARDSKKFQREYDMRTSVERYHGRLDRDFGFEVHTVRGLEKMRLLTSLSDIVMLAVALVHVKKNQTNYASIFDFGFF